MTRTFLTWDEPLLPAAARELVEHYARTAEAGGLLASEARMDQAVVVLPGARAGRRLRELLLFEAERRGLRFIPPVTVTVGGLPQLLLRLPAPIAQPAVRRLAWANAVRAYPRDRVEMIFPHLPAEGASAVAWRGMARELARLSQAAAAGGLRFAEVAERCRLAGQLREARRWDVLASIQNDYEALLARAGRGESGLLDPDLARIDAVADGRVAMDRDLWLVGVAELPPVVRSMVACLGAPPRVVVHAPSSHADSFDAFGCVIPERWADESVPVPDDAISVVDDPVAQAEVVVRELQALGGRYAADEILIGVPSADVIPSLTERLARAGVPVRDGAGRAMSSSGPWRLLAAVADVLAPHPHDRSHGAIAALVRHPDLQIDDERLTALDRWFNEHLPARLPPPDMDGRDDQDPVGGLLREIETELLAGLEGARPLSAWGRPMLEVLARVYERAKLDPADARGRATLRALDELRGAIEPLAHLPAALDVECTAGDALRIVLDEAAGGRIPDAADEAAVELLGWLELHLDDAPVTIVTGVNDGALPEAVRGDAFLPDGLRSELGLEDNAQRYARDLYRLTAIVRPREVIHLISGRRSSLGDPLRPSRLLFATDPESAVHRVRRFYDSDIAESSRPPHAAAERADSRAPSHDTGPVSAFRLPPESTLQLEPFPERIAVTAFRSLLADPYSWVLEQMRGIRSLDDTAVEMDGALFGSLAHEILEQFGRMESRRHLRGEVELDEARLWASLRQILVRTASVRFAGRPRIAVRAQLEQLEARLRAFARWHAGRLNEGWRIRTTELAVKDGLRFEASETLSTRLTARIDRIDWHVETGEWQILDYKTSDEAKTPDKTHRVGKGDLQRWTDLQLPLYRWMIEQGIEELGATPAIDQVSVGYIVLPRDLDHTGCLIAEWSPADFDSAMQEARSVLNMLASPVPHDRDRRQPFSTVELDALFGRRVMSGMDEDSNSEVSE